MERKHQGGEEEKEEVGKIPAEVWECGKAAEVLLMRNISFTLQLQLFLVVQSVFSAFKRPSLKIKPRM